MSISVDDTTVARWTGAPTGTNCQSAAFTPPDNSLLVVCACADNNSDDALAIAGGGLSWGAPKAFSNYGIPVYIWTAAIGTGASMQIAITNGASTQVSCKCYIVTGHDVASPIGDVHDPGGYVQTNNYTYSFTATSTGRVFGSGGENSNFGLPTSSDVGSGLDGTNQDFLSVYKAADHVPDTVTLNFDAFGASAPTGAWCVIALEIKVGAAAAQNLMGQACL